MRNKKKFIWGCLFLLILSLMLIVSLGATKAMASAGLGRDVRHSFFLCKI